MLHRQHYFPLDLARRHQLQRVSGFLKGIYLRDMRAELPLTEPKAEPSDAAGKGLRLTAREIAPEYAHHRSALEKREVQRQLGDLTGGEADDQKPPAPGDASRGGPETASPETGNRVGAAGSQLYLACRPFKSAGFFAIISPEKYEKWAGHSPFFFGG